MRLVLVASLLVLNLILAACGGAAPTATPTATDPPTATATTTATAGEAFPATVADGLGNEVTVSERPERIVSLSATATEMLFAIGAGEQVEAVDSTSDFPPEAPTTELAAYEPNVEAIADHDPDLVVIAFDPGDLAAGLGELDIPVAFWDAAPTLDDAYGQMRALGALTGNQDGAAAAVEQMQGEIEQIVAEAPRPDEPLSYYHELDDNYYTATSKTFVGDVYGLFGLENIADDADPDGTGYPQLSAEHIIEADPDLIFLADVVCCGQDADTVSARDGWDEITAVRQGQIVELDDALASRWGPRTTEFVRTVAEALDEAAG